MNLLREYVRMILVEASGLPDKYFSVINDAISSSRFWEEPNTQKDIDYYTSAAGGSMGTPAAEVLSTALQKSINDIELDMDVIVRSYDTEDFQGMTLHPDHPAWPNRWLVDASWYVSKQRPGRNTIDIMLMTSEDEDDISSALDSSALIRHIAQTIRHELVHYTQMKKQAKNKGLDDAEAFEEMIQDPSQVPDDNDPKYWEVYEPTGEFDEEGNEKIRKEGRKKLYIQDYLRSHIEIDAHAHDAAEELLAIYNEDQIKDILSGKVDLSDRKLPNAILHYYEILGGSHEVTHKFMSKLYTQVERMKKNTWNHF